MTLISDPSPGFPDNTNASFKIRLQTPLDLRNPNWEVALVSLTVPNRGIGRAELGFTSAADVVMKGEMMIEGRTGGRSRMSYLITAGDLFKNVHHVATSGVELWTRLSNALHEQIERTMTTMAHADTRWYQYYTGECPTIEVDPVKQMAAFRWKAGARFAPTVKLDVKFAKVVGMVRQDASSNAWVLNPDVAILSLPVAQDSKTLVTIAVRPMQG